MINHTNIDDYSFLKTDDKLYLCFPAQQNDVLNAKILYNGDNVLLLIRNDNFFVFKDIPTNIRQVLQFISSLTVVETKSDNKTIVQGYELDITVDKNVPDYDNMEQLFDADFSFLKEHLNEAEYEKIKNKLGII